ncbi:MAG: hypothetical protein AAGC86_09845 [Pseudomonadota bacterium]
MTQRPERPAGQRARNRTCCRVAAISIAALLAAGPAGAQEAGVQEAGADGGDTASGGAVDWSLAARTRIGIEGDLNRDLDPDAQGALLTQALEAGLVLDAQTKRSLLSAELGVSARYFIGDGNDLGGTGRLDPSLSINHSYTGKTYQVDTRAGLAVTRAAFSQADDTGTTDANASQFTVNYGSSLTQQLDTQSSVTAGVNGTYTDFSESAVDLVPTFVVGTTAGWNRQITETSALSFDLGFRHFAADNPEDTRSQTADLSARLQHRRTPRHMIGVTLGTTGVRTTETGTGTDFDINATGGIALDYALRSLSASLGLDQSIEPSSEGRLESQTRVSGSLGYQVNRRQQSSLTLSYSRRTPLGSDTGETRDFLRVSPSYSIALTPAASFTFGYAFRLSRDDTDGLATGHQVFAFLERRFDLLP